MKLKSIVLIFIAFVAGVLFVVFSTKAQKSKANEELKNEAKSDEKLMAELRKTVVCAKLNENMLVKENDEWIIKQAQCENSSVNLMIQRGKEKLSVLILDARTSEEARKVVSITHGQPAYPSKDYGDEGNRVSVGGKIKSINFIKGRIFAHIACNPCNSNETPKRFAEYVLTAIEGQ